MRLKGSKNKEKPDQSIIKYLVTYKVVLRTGKFGDQPRVTEIVKGDLEEWFIERATNNPQHTIIVEVCCEFITKPKSKEVISDSDKQQ